MTAPAQQASGVSVRGRRPGRRALGVAAFLRGRIRASEFWLAIIAAAVGAASGLATLAIGAAARFLQVSLFGISPDTRLSTVPYLALDRLPVLPIGGLLVGLLGVWWASRRPGPPVDAVEANALRGGRMSGRDSLFVVAQTMCSNGFGASVGLEAAYAQIGGAIGSITGGALNLRRSDMRTFVGAGAGAGIAAAFGAPLTGAFYAFEIIIGSYSVAGAAPVVAAALAGALMTRLVGVDTLVLRTTVTDQLTASHYLLFAALGLVCALAGIAIMRLTALAEGLASRLPVPKWARPAIGGAMLAAIAFFQPETLSAGHGAMHVDFQTDLTVVALAILVLSKTLASVTALGFGFRGGLFFASLYLGSLLGRLFIACLFAAGLKLNIDPLAAALVGMGALAVAVIGGPFTMSFLVLETTGDFGLAAATLTASIVASLIVRELFGYSFSTWRLHLRGETIRSAHDVGWLRTLTAGRMMRRDLATTEATTSVEAFRHRFPLGSTRRVIALDHEGRYAGIVPVAAAYGEVDPAAPVSALAQLGRDALTPDLDIKACMRRFDDTASDELAVVDAERRPLGVLSESFATRRYAEELEKARRDLTGGD
ncbi:MAG TPA: chloride channel protein [Caulobacteraceae bacterium]|nr:chloride channel protein [Caulobacteraceae bacterium]